MEEIQAAIERLNNMEEVDEAELEKLEAEIEQRIRALEDENRALRETADPEELKKLEGTSGTLLDKTEKGWELLDGVSDWLRAKSLSQSHSDHAGTSKSQEKIPEEAPCLPPLTKEQRKTLNLLDKWTKSERGSASKLYGAAGVRADLVQSYGRLLMKKARPLSSNGIEVLSELEASLPTVVKKQEVTEQVGYEKTTREVDAILSRIEDEVKNSTSIVSQHLGGGIAAPGVMAIGGFYSRQSKTVQRLLLVGFLVIITVFYLTLYEEEEDVEETMVEKFEDEGIAFSNTRRLLLSWLQVDHAKSLD
uniref:Uncharacterized protein n=1 Tax=Pyramimonas obovata TaxID=1411642 RepID=A0A7S0RJS6_9CHLO|mmetsp:Transcript_35785/g.78121  ORF Transcript_35785/g.78121 Transcript_35785/m.78121 type:complete len:306 (+) Transcript_35785:401-1318(+)